MKEKNRLKITFEYDDREFSASIHEDSTITEVGEALKGLLVAVGFHKDNVEELFYQDE
ncbi:MAG: hypothetical protein HWN81_22770 [Candidatus Lokiarchaeota archaeon]|nr:hypothetical protein [Candidatus Lokiarchaeota archaeon]